MAERAKCEICNRDFPSLDALNMHNSVKHQVTEKPSKKNYKFYFTIFFIIILLIAGYYLINGEFTGNSINNPSNENTQKITLSFKNYNYYPQSIVVKEGIPVELTLDNSIRGCFRTFVIKDLGVKKTSSKPSDTIIFTPDKKGSFIFACGMHMGTGTIIVE